MPSGATLQIRIKREDTIMTREAILKKALDMASHNLLCYSANLGMTIPKEGKEKEHAEAAAEAELLDAWLKEIEPASDGEQSAEEVIVITAATKEKYTIAQYPKTPEEFAADMAGFTIEQLTGICYLRTQTCKNFMQRLEEAREVIDLVAEEIDMTDSDRYFYGAPDGESALVEKIRQYLDRGGDKVKLKRRIDELEKENAVLRSLLTGSGAAS